MVKRDVVKERTVKIRPPLSPEQRDQVSRLVREESGGADFRAGFKTVVIDENEGSGQAPNPVTYFVVEGDLLKDEDELFAYVEHVEALQRLRESDEAVPGAASPVSQQPGALLGIIENGKIVRWNEGLVLSYCLLKWTFTGPQQLEHYDLVRQSMLRATKAWEETCGVQFQYRDDLDTVPTGTTRPAEVLFPVREIDAGGNYIAMSFFPNEPVNRRRLLVDPSYYTTNFDKVGVLQHELGHVLGFRHEHIRTGARPGCPGESLVGTFELTNYDPKSVMHYYCPDPATGLGGTLALGITELDRIGAQRVYGPPFTEVRFFE